MRVLIVAGNISARMGGEAVIPLHYIRELTKAGVEVHALTHARVREELQAHPAWRPDRFHFIEDSGAEKAIHAAGKRAPGALRETLFLSGVGLVTQARLARVARTLAHQIGANVIHQPIPVSPAFPSFFSGMPAPVVIGPMNGGMEYPPAFAKDYSQGSGAVISAARLFAGVGNRLAPGKRQAAALLVANARTRSALPPGIDRARVVEIAENGVDLEFWNRPLQQKPAAPVFVFVGRLVWWKAVELLLEAMESVPDATLRIIGDGPERARLQHQASVSSASGQIAFEGFRPQAEICSALTAATALVLPSMRECGGAVILEAFACRTPAIATDWGGPQDYITQETGFLIAPSARASFVEGLAAAMRRLATDPGLASRMGAAARAHVEAQFTWAAKAHQMIGIYEDAMKQKA
ncbi:MAG: glycosyltransferase family 4 protein [Parvularculaceae bacterium]|nr:glycosyltransferase family 4 protein [Parvularculaceae bacterium]